MEIPGFWARAQDDVQPLRGGRLALVAWGWSTASLADAQAAAAERLRRLLARVRQGEALPKGYAYGSRPIREEIIQELAAGDGDPAAVLTRNRYGSLVLNTARPLFLDVDLPPARPASWLSRLSGQRSAASEDAVLDTLRTALRSFAPTTFRIYRTAAGFRAMAIDQEFRPEAPETDRLLRLSGADPAFVQLCRAQKCFRARLTSKPWRCRYRLPPGQFPRESPSERQRFEQWLSGYAV
ncbi:MAG TPA: hypothetical protein VGQ73_08355 [Gemmatimonadales bacterium]|nr:hypothetical protein [Gemmatimonadales bacterium]